MAQYKIEVDEATCIGCGACAAQCDENFEIEENEDGEVKAKVKQSEVLKLGCNKDAQEVCPVSAIKITEK